MSNLLSTILPYIPPAVVRAALLGTLPTSPQGTVSEAAVLFADVSGFTPLTEALAQKGPQGPEELTRLLNTYFSRMIALIESEGGEVVKFGGDAVTVLFPATSEPLSHATRRAYQAALAMQEAMIEFAELETSIGSVALGLKIGIGAGEVLAMQVGGVRERWEYVIAGSPLRQVAEAEQRAQRGDIILSPAANAIMPPAPLPPQAIQRPDWERKADQATVAADCKRFIPGAILRWLEEGLRDWVAILRPMSVLFIGVGGLDYALATLAWRGKRGERADATEKLHTFLRAVQETLYRYEGSLNKLAVDDKGTILLALFGAPPFAHEDDPERAVRCALDLQQVAVQQGLQLAIGVTSGQVFAGPVGGPTRREYTVMGDTVNLAARLMGKAGASGILTDFKTFRQARHQLVFEHLTPVRLKGKAGLIRLYRPTGSTHQQYKAPHSTMIGRQRELAVLSATLDAVSAGQNRILIIEGEAGIGKSRLVAELRRQMEERGLTGLLGAGQSIEQHTPYRAWRDIFVSYFELEDVTQQAERQQRVTHVVHNIAPAQIERLSLLNDLLNLNLPESSLVASLDDALRQQNLTLLLLTLLRAWAKERPLILVLEDAHWLDSLSWELAVQVARGLRVAGNPLLLLLVTRPLEQHQATSLTTLRAMKMSESLRLESLSPDDTVRLVTAGLALPTDDLPEAIAELVRQRAEGNPFFAEELVLTLRDQGLITIKPSPKAADSINRCLISGDLESQTLPNTLQGLILARIDQLAPQKQLTLKMAAVIGRSFAYTPLHELLKQQTKMVEKTLKAYLTNLTEQELTLLETPAPHLSYIFKHIITQEVAYQSLLFAQRRQLHRAVAEWYENTNADLAPYYPLLVHHYHHAAEREQERHYAKLAGEQAAGQYANDEAIHYFSRALELTEESDYLARYELLLARENVYDWQGKREAQAQDIVALTDIVARLNDNVKKATVNLRKAKYARRTGDNPAALLAVQQAIGYVALLDQQALQAEAYYIWGLTLRKQSLYHEAQQRLEQALTLARASQLPKLEADSLQQLGTVNYYRGNLSVAVPYYEQALPIYRVALDRKGEADCLVMLAAVQTQRGDYLSGQQQYREALSIYEMTGYRIGQTIALANLGNNYCYLGEYEVARDYQQQVLLISQQIGYREGENFALSNLALLDYHLGHHNIARDKCQEVLALHHEIGDRYLEGYTLTYLGHTLAESGQWQLAREAYQKAIQVRRQLGHEKLVMDDLAGLANVAMREGKKRQALRYVTEILAWIESHGTEGIEYPLQVYLTCYQVLQANAKNSPAALVRADRSLLTAHSMLQERAAKISDPQMRQMFLQNVAVHQEIVAAWENKSLGV